MGCLRFSSRCIAAALCCAALAACSDVERLELSDATLEGKITYQGQPVPYALVIVTNGEQSSTGRVATDGTYKVKYAPLGDVRIAVNTDAGRGMMMGEVMAARHSKDKKPGAKFIGIPKKYHDPSKSEITTTIKDEANHFDITIE